MAYSFKISKNQWIRKIRQNKWLRNNKLRANPNSSLYIWSFWHNLRKNLHMITIYCSSLYEGYHIRCMKNLSSPFLGCS